MKPAILGGGRLVSVTALLSVCFSGPAAVATTLVLYPSTPGYQSDGRVTGTLNGQSATFEYQYTYHPESFNQKDFKANWVRFAANGPVDVQLVVNATITSANLRTVGKDLPFNRNGSTFQFTLPGPGNYYLQLPNLNTSGKITYTVFFFFDDLATYNAYQQSFATAKNVLNNGVVSDPTQNQTSAIQNILNGRGAIYFPPGTYRTGQLNIGSNTTIYMAPGALLKGTDNYNTSRYLYTNGSSNVRIAGLGVIDVNGRTSANLATKGHGWDVESTSGVTMDDVMIRDSNSWMLHVRRCDQVNFTNIKVFSGKDGIDPDGARDMTVRRAVIQSIDDGFAVKSKFSGRSCERVSMRDCIVFSCASSLKIGTENYYGVVKDITWDGCDAVDADRGCIMYTNVDQGDAPISNITWRNIRVFTFNWSAETGGAPFQFTNSYGTSVSGLLVENVVAYPQRACTVSGPLSVTFRNVVVNGSSSIPTSGVTFAGVIWPGITSQSRPVVFIEPSTRNQNEYFNSDIATVSVQHPFGKGITVVELYADGALLGADNAAPYTFSLAGLALGERILTAKAIDVDGATNTTAPKRIRIVASPAPAVAITSGPTVSGITQTAATVTWSTNPAGNSIVDYGLTGLYGQTASDAAVVTSHSIFLTGLTPNTTYHYRVRTQAAGYDEANSGDRVFTTQAPPGSLRNPGFEDGFAQTAWIRYGVFDSSGNSGIQTGPWFNILPHGGAYFAGSASSYGTKNGGFYQRVTGFEAGKSVTFTAWVCTYNKGSADPARTNNRIGIDPAGGTDPAAAGIVWSPRVATQYAWQQVSVEATATGTSITFLLEAQQLSAVEWNLNAFDDCAVTQAGVANSLPVIVSNAISANTLIADNNTPYTVTLRAADADGAVSLVDMRLLLDTGGQYSAANGRGNLAWGLTDGDITHFGGQWTMMGDAAGGGRWAWRLSDWGSDTYISPVSAATSTSGNERTVAFTFKAKTAWAPASNQGLRGFARDSQNADTGWVQASGRYNVVKLPGDMDLDGDVDQTDFGYFQACLTGSGLEQADPNCAGAMLDGDVDVDQDDFAFFQACMSGPNAPVNPNCGR